VHFPKLHVTLYSTQKWITRKVLIIMTIHCSLKMLADVEFSQEYLESLADDYASRGALDYKFIIQVIPVSFQVLSN
jgi:hypothetical protein